MGEGAFRMGAVLRRRLRRDEDRICQAHWACKRKGAWANEGNYEHNRRKPATFSVSRLVT